ncbi:amino acid deaminase/aldolase [Neobacillus bataviensis]|uniref:amino acid deaminase/aldolase n=1 Tax=Neobacillus bataviensis TaxID=220685 RepID=UPI001CC053DF|nr:amino acid deaminase/aldolase [Neobacillus bataviensis]
MEQDYNYYKKIFASTPKPFAFVDFDLLDENIERIVTAAAQKNIRIATKSIRSVFILNYILKKHAQFQGVMCFTANESMYLVNEGIEDILIGYPIWDSEAVAQICQLNQQGKRITLMVDSVEHVHHLNKMAEAFNVTLPLCLDIDMSMDVTGLHFGVWRSPIRSVADLKEVVEKIIESSSVCLVGVMGYEAQIAGVGDHYPKQMAKNTMVTFLKKQSIKQLAEKRAATIQMIENYGISLQFVNGGGTGSLHTTTSEDVVTEVTVGSGFFSPGLFDNYRDFHYKPAAGFAIEIVRKPDTHIFTCTGGGYIASGAVGNDKLPKPYLPEDAQLLSLEGAGEVQTPIVYRGTEKLMLGDPIFLRHAKAGELCERFNHLYCVSKGEIVNKVTTYRGDGQCFL